jgi:flagellar basal body-associated protein FliL
MAKGSKKSLVIAIVVSLVIGFLIGEILPLQVFSKFNITATMGKPGGFHRRSGF